MESVTVDLESAETPSVQTENAENIEKTETRKETETIEFDNIDPKEYGIEIEEDEFQYDPLVEDDTLPDLYNLLETLQSGDTDLEAQRQPPSLFTRPEHVPNYQKISELRLEIEEAKLGPYLEDFADGVKDDVVLLGEISLDEIQDEERRLRDEHIAYQDQEAVRSRQTEEKLLRLEEEVKLRVAKFTKEKREDIARREELMKQREKLLLDRLHKAFRRAESRLVGTLESRKGAVKTLYGDLMLAEGQYGGSRGRRWKVDWDRTPQPIQVKLKCLRGVKDKLPAGRYVMMVSLHNRLGGHVMRWSKLKGQQWGGATLPVFHEGNFSNVEMKIDQSVFTVLPAKPSLRPGFILVFELFLLRGSVVHTDRVVGWGCFPICDGQFDIIEGKCRCPFLRGEMDANIDKHDKIEELMASDMDHWLSNLYFEVVKLPRYLAGQKEYEVELQFTSALTGYPDRVKTGWEENKDGEDPLPGSVSDVGSDGHGTGLSQLTLTSGDLGTENATNRSEAAPSKVRLLEQDSESKGHHTPATTIMSRVITKDNKKLKLEDSSDAESDADSVDDAYVMKTQEHFKPVKGMRGMYYKRYLTNPADVYYRRMYSMLPKTELLVPQKKRKKLTHLEQLEKFSFGVQPPFTGKGHMAQYSQEKLNYIERQFLAELGLSQWRSREFWGMLLMFIVVFFIRMFLHYLGQWAFLSAIEIPVNKFNFLPYTVDLNYQPTLLRAREEIAVVIFGPMINIVVFSMLVFFAWLCPKIFNTFPDLFSKLVINYGLATLLDPLLILIIDCILQRYTDQATEPIGDFAKLYWNFYRSQGSGLAGIFITIFLYVFTSFITASILYMYFLRLHNNGRMLDIFWRLHGEEENFFIPYDLELSNQELSHICRKAEQWRGEEGERRKVAIYDYIWEEEEVEESIWDENGEEIQHKQQGRKEITTHVSIHTLHLDGLRELYRHFLRLPDGAIVEVFGDMSVPGMDRDVKKALEKGSHGLDNLLSQAKVRGRRTVNTSHGFRDDTLSPGLSSSPTPSSAGSFVDKKHM
ncbi:uncharacterized protein LOC121377431 [Gigantopelta aegis]|uniref:uncharacterized protein LOC121377431 n=1 Tax=Gigantopelta aegis TaxID=1735272 RepID=UPI001B88E0FE|nr:uncharacterized protein LOC121377431 [Gigantopelta aegis]